MHYSFWEYGRSDIDNIYAMSNDARRISFSSYRRNNLTQVLTLGCYYQRSESLLAGLIFWVSIMLSMRPKIPQKSEQQVQVSYDQEATTLLQYLGQEQHPDYGFGAVSGSIYDTAWVSMVKKPVAGSKTAWAFIECFQFLSEAQCEDGGWDADAVLFDRIACTLAGLLALKKHQNEEKDHTSRQALGKKIFKATHFLRQTLPMLPAAVAYELPIGAELWLPKMLELIEEEGIHLDNAAVLAWILPARDKKISRFPIETLYKKGFTSVAHSLEGLIGYADFNRVSMLKTCGSMMGSPSATAAYLIYSENWDADAEAYIRRALNCPHAGQNGGVPSTYPTTAFESSWVRKFLSLSSLCSQSSSTFLSSSAIPP